MRVLILANSDAGLYKFRKELVEELLSPGSYLEERTSQPAEVYLAMPNGQYISALTQMGCNFIDTPMERHGTNPLDELKLLKLYCKILKEIKPDIVFTYTIKPNVYGGMACRIMKVPCVMNITGLGTALENPGKMQKLMLMLYKLALPGAKKVFFQNEENRQFFLSRGMAVGKNDLLPGSGVNLSNYAVLVYPDDQELNLVFIARIMKEKGIDQYLDAAKYIRAKYPQTRFHVCGACEPEYDGELHKCQEDGTIIYHGLVKDMTSIYKMVHCVVHPTYYPEGMSNVLLEACASSRAIITTDRSGCREIVDDGGNGFVVKQRNSEDLIEKIESFIALSYDEKKKMGLEGRAKVEREFNRKSVVSKYIKELSDR